MDKNEAHDRRKNGKYHVKVEDGKIIQVEESKVNEFRILMSG